MTNGEFMDLVIKDLKAYHATGAMESVERNAHMNDHRGHPICQETVDALLVDFVNFIGMRRGMDLGLYTRDLREEPAQPASAGENEPQGAQVIRNEVTDGNRN